MSLGVNVSVWSEVQGVYKCLKSVVMLILLAGFYGQQYEIACTAMKIDSKHVKLSFQEYKIMPNTFVIAYR